MSDVTDRIPRSDMTAEQKRRLGALQASMHLLFGNSYNVTAETKCNNVSEILRLARFVNGGDA